jgi:hypothetical protein
MFNVEWLVLENLREGNSRLRGYEHLRNTQCWIYHVLIFSMNQTFFPYSYIKSKNFKKILVDDICHPLHNLLLILISVSKARDRPRFIGSLFLTASLGHMLLPCIDCRFCLSGKAGCCSVGSISFDLGCIS